MFKKKNFLVFTVSSLLLVSFVLIQSCSKNKKEINKEDLSSYEQISQKTEELFNNRYSSSVTSPKRLSITVKEIIEKTSLKERLLVNDIISYSKIAEQKKDASIEFNETLKKIQAASGVNKETLLSTLFLAKGLVSSIKNMRAENQTSLTSQPINLGCCYSFSIYYYNYTLNLCNRTHDPSCSPSNLIQWAIDVFDQCNDENWYTPGLPCPNYIETSSQ